VTGLVIAGGWSGFLWLQSLRSFSAKYVINGYTSTRWSVICLLIAAGASALAAGLLLALCLGAIRTRALGVRLAVGGMGLIAYAAGALYLLVVCSVVVLLAGAEGTQTLVSAEDGTTVMITQDGFDGDVVNFYDPVHGWEWARRPELGRLDPREGPCTLKILDTSTLILTCGPHSQELARR
jgi:hypothetical protein